MVEPDPFHTARRWVPWLLLALVLGLAAAVRMHDLGAESLWLDEAYTHRRAALPPAETIKESIEKGHVPTYFLFMHYWIALGDDEFMLRLPSVIFGVLTVAAAFGLGRLLGGFGVGLVAALLTALSPFQVRYAQEARMYTMLTFAATVALIGLVYLLKHPDQAGVPLWRRSTWADGAQGRARRWAWLAYVAGTVLTLYLHNTSVFFVATCQLCALVLLAASRGVRLHVIGNWTLANATVLAAWSVWIGTLLQQARKVQDEFWPNFPKLRAIEGALRDLYIYSEHRIVWIDALFGVLILLGLIALRKSFRLALGLFVLAFASPALVLLVSALFKPMFITRIMLWAAVPAFALIACGVFALPFRLVQYLLIGALLFTGQKSLERYYRGTRKPPWQKIARELHEQADRKTRILSSGSQERTSLAYYWSRKTNPIPAVKVSAMHGRKGPYVIKQTRGYDRVWIIDYKRGKRYATRQAMATLDERATLTSKDKYGNVVIYRYDLTQKPKPPPEPAAAPPPLPGPLTAPVDSWPGPLPDPNAWPGPLPDPNAPSGEN